MSFPRLSTKPIEYYSTNNYAERVHFPEALLNGMASNHGLYMLGRKDVPKLHKATIKKMADQTYAEIAFEVLYPYLQWHITDEELGTLLADAYDEKVIPTPIQHVRDRLYIMWLTKGPTCSFKDYAARFYARILNYFLCKRGLTRIVLVATSGDTGPAVADALKGMSNAFVVIFYPDDSVSAHQRRQMTTLGDNVFAIAVKNAHFGICQDIVKRLMADKDFAFAFSGDRDIFTSANSISLGRQLPQIVYPFFGYSRIGGDGVMQILPVIPSGNFGDIKGTGFAKEMKLPVSRMICAQNENRAFVDFLATGVYEVKPRVLSPSSAMIVPNPSNFARLVDFYGGHVHDVRDPKTGATVSEGVITRMPDLEAMRRDFFAASVSNGDCYWQMKNTHDRHGIILDPHGAVGMRAYEEMQLSPDIPAIVYETADPGKFPGDVRATLGFDPEIPEQMKAQESLPEREYMVGFDAERDKEGRIKCLSQAQYDEAKVLLMSILQPLLLSRAL